MFDIGIFPPAPAQPPPDTPAYVGGTMPIPRSTRPQPVRLADFPEVPLPEFELVLDVYRQMHRFGIPRADARRETRVTLELLAWAAIRQAAAAKKAKANRR